MFVNVWPANVSMVAVRKWVRKPVRKRARKRVRKLAQKRARKTVKKFSEKQNSVKPWKYTHVPQFRRHVGHLGNFRANFRASFRASFRACFRASLRTRFRTMNIDVLASHAFTNKA